MDQENKKPDNQGVGNKNDRQGQQNIPHPGSSGGQKPDVNPNFRTGDKEAGSSERNKGINKPSDLESEESDT